MPIAAGPTHVIYYNSQMFADVGYESFPQTWDEMLDAFEKLKSKGIIPIAMGNKNGDPAQSGWLAVIADRYTGSEWFESICEGEGASFTDPEFVRALKAFKDLADKGYLNKDLNSIDNTTMQNYFFEGKAAAMIDGIWAVTNIDSAAPQEILDVTKCAVFPAVEGGKGNPLSSAGSAGIYYCINSNVTDPEKRAACMEMLEYMTGKQCAEIMASVGGFPAYDPKDFDTTKLTPLAKEAYTLCNQATPSRIYDLWLDASIITTLNNGLQEMLAGTMEPENLAEQVQQSYADYLAFK